MSVARIRPPERRHALIGGLALLVVLLLTLVHTRPPALEPADAPADAFSGARAWSVLEDILGDGAPHPVGTSANADVRARIRGRLAALGLAVTEQETTSCAPHGRCARVTNVLARIEPRPGPPVAPIALVVHHDSVAAAPGAGDDGSGVAVAIEVARALVEEPPLRPVLLVFTDAEEVGLLGARAFVDQHPWARELAGVVNADARGTCGRTTLFETGANNAAMITAFLGAARRPVGTSLAYEVYRRLPNDTDLTVFKDAGVGGLNFAFIEGVGRYHTGLDDLKNLCPGTLQDQGEHVLAAVRGLAEAPTLTADHDLVFGDVLGLLVLRWPAPWSTGLALAALAWILAASLVSLRRRAFSMRAALIAALAVVVVLVSSTLVGVALAAGLDRVGARLWYARPLPYAAALALASAATWLASARWLGRRCGPTALRVVIGLFWAGLALAVALAVPGASIVFVVPAIAAALDVQLAIHRPGWPSLCAPTITAVLWMPLVYGFVHALGLESPLVLLVPAALCLLSSAPNMVAAPRRAVWILAAAAAVVAVVAASQPAYDEQTPRPQNLVLFEDRDADVAKLYAGAWGGDGIAAALRDAGGFVEAESAALPWPAAIDYVAPATRSDAPAPAVEASATPNASGRTLRLSLRPRA
ncbi:MAG: M20/M25/M40 family metallo-hydrolase, partial [Myxococcales bacterium]|nr:M20/M25/M40 family metallo-hydrolase [Myxococcales bacterium]